MKNQLELFCQQIDDIIRPQAKIIGGYIQGNGALVSLDKPLYVNDETRAAITKTFGCQTLATIGVIMMSPITFAEYEPDRFATNRAREVDVLELIGIFQANTDRSEMPILLDNQQGDAYR